MASRRRAARSVASSASGSTPSTAYGSSAIGAGAEPGRRSRPQRPSWTSRDSGLRRSGPWRPAGTPSVMHADRATSSGTPSSARSSASDGVVPHRQRAAVAQRPGRQQQVLARRVHRGALVRVGGPVALEADEHDRRGPARGGRRSAASPPASGPVATRAPAPPPASRSARLSTHDVAERPAEQRPRRGAPPGRRDAG